MSYAVLAVYPKSNSTCFALYQSGVELFSREIHHEQEELECYATFLDQWSHRCIAVEKALSEFVSGREPLRIDGVIGPGGVLDAVRGGVYDIDAHLLARLHRGIPQEHVSNLGGLLAHALAKPRRIPAYIADPISTDEMDPIAKKTGLKELPLIQWIHALNIRAVVNIAAEELEKEVSELSFIVAHLGKSFSICAYQEGRMVDMANSRERGPFSPARSGKIPSAPLIRMAYSGAWNKRTLRNKMVKEGGMLAWLGTYDLREVRSRIDSGDEQAERVYRAMAYAAAMEIAAQAAALKGRVDGILITGGCAWDSHFIALIQTRVQWIAPVFICPGEDRLKFLADAVLRVLRGKEKSRGYNPPIPSYSV